MNTYNHDVSPMSGEYMPSTQNMNYLDVLYDGASSGQLAVFNKRTKHHEWFNVADLDSASAFMADTALEDDVYHGWCLFDDAGRRHPENATTLPGLFIDLDIKSSEEGVHANNDRLPSDWEEAVEYIQACGLPKPTAIRHSGNGKYVDYLFDVPWKFADAHERAEAALLSNKFQQCLIAAFKARGWKLDNVGDLSRITRLPGTWNHKTMPPKPTSLISFDFTHRISRFEMRELVDRAKARFRIGGAHARKSSSVIRLPRLVPGLPIEAAPMVDGGSENANFEAIVRSCPWMADVAHSERIPEPEWYAAAGIVGRCKGGVSIFHQISQTDPRYDPSETTTKIARALSEAGPRTCRSIRDDLGCTHCANCVFNDNEVVRSPLKLGSLAPPVAELLAKHVFDVSQCLFIDLETGIGLTDKQFSSKYRPWTDKPPHFTLLNSPLLKRVDSSDYIAGERKRFIERDGVSYYNSWRPSKLMPAPGDCSLLMEHIEMILPDEGERKHFLDALAHAFQRPHEKVRHLMMIIGKQGTGKSLIGSLLAEAFGVHNTYVAESGDLTDNFNAGLCNKQLLVVEEVSIFEKKETYNKIKPLIADEFMNANEKNVKKFRARTPRLIIAFSNHARPISPEKYDRRFFIYLSPADKREPEYYERLSSDGAAQLPAFVHALMQRDISHFSPNAEPPMTEAKREILEASAPLVEQEIKLMMADEVEPFHRALVGSTDVHAQLVKRMVHRPSMAQVQDALKALGFTQVRQIRLINNKRVRPWAWKDHDRWVNADTTDIRQELGLPANIVEP